MRKGSDGKAASGSQAGDQPRRKKRRSAGILKCGIGVLLGLSGLLLARAGQLWIGFDVFSHFTVHFALMAAAFGLGMLMPRARLRVAFILLLAGVVAIGVWPHAASRSPRVLATAGTAERALTVASFNIFWVNQHADRVRGEIERLDADIVTLVEVHPGNRRVLDQLKARYPFQADCFTISHCNLAILSRLPIEASEGRGRWEGPPYLLARLGPEAGGLRVMVAHTIRFPYSREQFRQAREIAKLLEALPGHKLLMGDLNATPFSRILSVIEDGANLRGVTHLPSWPATLGLPQIAIDHILLSPRIRLLEAARIGQAAGSDHYPVAARIAVPLAP